MNVYRNVSGNSGVYAYTSDVTSITVQFKTGAIYKYTYASAGSSKIEQMKRLAVQGHGLNGYIMNYAKTAYAAKLR